MTNQIVQTESQQVNNNLKIDEKTCQMNKFRYGLPCPACGSDAVNYDGLLNLVCPDCGLHQGGAFT